MPVAHGKSGKDLGMQPRVLSLCLAPGSAPSPPHARSSTRDPTVSGPRGTQVFPLFFVQQHTPSHNGFW